MTFFIYLCI